MPYVDVLYINYWRIN